MYTQKGFCCVLVKSNGRLCPKVWREDCDWRLLTDSIGDGLGLSGYDDPLSPGMGWGGFGLELAVCFFVTVRPDSHAFP